MYSLKGFVSFAGFANNVPGQVAKIGELSSYSSTYAKDKGYYDDVTNKDIQLTTFFSKLDNVAIEVPVELRPKIFEIIAWVYGQMIATTNTQDRTTFLMSLGATFAADMEQIECGAVVNDGTYYIPEWISWKVMGADSYIRFWFTDDSFRAQYDEFEIVVVPALELLDNFFLPATEVETRLNAMTTTVMVDRLQVAKGNYPETIIKVLTYNYVAPGNPNYKVPSRWGVLIYGIAGDNVDSIKDALVNYILANSTHPRADWVDLIPDLFKRTEFIITPLWYQYGIPNRRLEAGIYSPLVKVDQATYVAKQTATMYPAAHVDNYISFMGHPYKSLALAIVGGPENREGKFWMTDFYPDFINVNTSSIDFNRMTPETQALSGMLAEMIFQAETVDKYTVLPFGMTRLVRDDILYIVKTVDNVQFLVVAKSNFGDNPTVETDPNPVMPA